MVTSEPPSDPSEAIGLRDALALINQRIDDVHARIDDVNARIEELRGDVNSRFGDVNARIGDVNARIDELRTDMNARIDELRADMNARFRLLMWGIAIGFGAVLAILGAILARGG